SFPTPRSSDLRQKIIFCTHLNNILDFRIKINIDLILITKSYYFTSYLKRNVMNKHGIGFLYRLKKMSISIVHDIVDFILFFIFQNSSYNIIKAFLRRCYDTAALRLVNRKKQSVSGIRKDDNNNDLNNKTQNQRPDAVEPECINAWSNRIHNHQLNIRHNIREQNSQRK